ncbi:MAG: hypothetical protein QOD72_3735 [Acidimicrobiaceae bacterium]|jgi:hypothetical protein|nr:hypothetical protein [Acidimicrobiaceae bacterium]
MQHLDRQRRRRRQVVIAGEQRAIHLLGRRHVQGVGERDVMAMRSRRPEQLAQLDTADRQSQQTTD